jgi:hypothetical protein
MVHASASSFRPAPARLRDGTINLTAPMKIFNDWQLEWRDEPCL